MNPNLDGGNHIANLIEEQVVSWMKEILDFPLVCFRFNPGGLERQALNLLNKAILIQLQEQGIAVPSYATLKGQHCLRMTIANHRSVQSDFDVLVEAVIRIGKQLNRKHL